MKVKYTVVVKKGYLMDLVFGADTLREAGYIADIFLDNLKSPENVDISITPIKVEEPEEEEAVNE